MAKDLKLHGFSFHRKFKIHINENWVITYIYESKGVEWNFGDQRVIGNHHSNTSEQGLKK